MGYCETSALSNDGIDELFESIIKNISTGKVMNPSLN